MTKHVLAIIFATALPGIITAQSKKEWAIPNQQIQGLGAIEPRFRLFKTENVWTFLELDTQTGQVWQVYYSISAGSSNGKNFINKWPLTSNGRNGRFTLYPTNNMWNFILVDQDGGGTWQVQFSMTPENRGIAPINSEDSE